MPPAIDPTHDRYELQHIARCRFAARFVARFLASGCALDISSTPRSARLLAEATPGVAWSHTEYDRRTKQDDEPSYYRPLPYVVAEGAEPPPGGPYDCVTTFELTEHLPFNPAIFFAAINRSLVSGGLLILSTPNVGGLGPLCRLARGTSPHQTPFFPLDPWKHRREYGVYEIRKLLEWAGYEPVRLETRDLYPSDPRGWRAWTRRGCLILAGFLAFDPAAVRQAILYLGSTQFWAARKVREPGESGTMPEV